MPSSRPSFFAHYPFSVTQLRARSSQQAQVTIIGVRTTSATSQTLADTLSQRERYPSIGPMRNNPPPSARTGYEHIGFSLPTQPLASILEEIEEFEIIEGFELEDTITPAERFKNLFAVYRYQYEELEIDIRHMTAMELETFGTANTNELTALLEDINILLNNAQLASDYHLYEEAQTNKQTTNLN